MGMIISLTALVIVGASVVLIGEALRRAPEGVEDEYGFHLTGESAIKKEALEERLADGEEAVAHVSFLGRFHSKKSAAGT